MDRKIEQETAARCPQCRELTADMGLDFPAPNKEDIKQWAHLKTLYSVGITFHSCGCSGPGYIPSTHDALITYFQEILKSYQYQLDALRLQMDEAMKEKKSESSRREPYQEQKEVIGPEEAKTYWISKVQEIEQKLAVLKGGR